MAASRRLTKQLFRKHFRKQQPEQVIDMDTLSHFADKRVDHVLDLVEASLRHQSLTIRPMKRPVWIGVVYLNKVGELRVVVQPRKKLGELLLLYGVGWAASHEDEGDYLRVVVYMENESRLMTTCLNL